MSELQTPKYTHYSRVETILADKAKRLLADFELRDKNITDPDEYKIMLGKELKLASKVLQDAFKANDKDKDKGLGYVDLDDAVVFDEVNQSIVHPREVFKTALLSSAAAIILVHQHPTGDPSASSEDIAITRRLKEAGEIMGIKILDHIIIGDSEYLSFVERGLL